MELPNRIKSFYIVIFVIFMIILGTRLVNFNSSWIFIFLVSCLVIYLALKFTQGQESKRNEELMYELSIIQDFMYKQTEKTINKFGKDMVTNANLENMYKRSTMKYLYMDPDLFHLYYGVLEFGKYDAEDLADVIKASNSLLQLRYELENIKDIQLPDYYYDNAYDFYRNIMNSMHSMMYNLQPATVDTRAYLTYVLKNLQLLLYRNLDKIKAVILQKQAENGITSNSKMFMPEDMALGYDTWENPNLTRTKLNGPVQPAGNFY